MTFLFVEPQIVNYTTNQFGDSNGSDTSDTFISRYSKPDFTNNLTMKMNSRKMKPLDHSHK